MKKCASFFSIFAQNIDCVYTLESLKCLLISRGWGTLVFSIYVGWAGFFFFFWGGGIIFNFNNFGGFNKDNYFWGVEIFVEILFFFWGGGGHF